MIDALERQPQRWQLAPGLRVVVAGSAAPESLFRRFDKFGVRVIQPWGMTETTPIATVCTLKPHMENWPEERKFQVRARQGLPSPFTEIRAIGDDGEVPWDGETPGELEIRGPFVAASYYKLPEERHRWSEDGWLRTGDVVTIDSEGYMKITDRTKDLIKSGGEWISSVDLENALVGHPAVREAAVVAIPHAKWVERPLAVVVITRRCPGNSRRTALLPGREVRQMAIARRLHLRAGIAPHFNRQTPQVPTADAVQGLVLALGENPDSMMNDVAPTINCRGSVVHSPTWYWLGLEALCRAVSTDWSRAPSRFGPPILNKLHRYLLFFVEWKTLSQLSLSPMEMREVSRVPCLAQSRFA